MLPKSYRLPHSVRLTRAHSLHSDFFTVRSVANELDSSRFGVVISKKVDKRAVVRNRMRRLIHQAVLTHLLPVASSQDTLFIVQKPFTELSEQLLEEVAALLKKVSS